MSRHIGKAAPTEFALGDYIVFDHAGDRLVGRVVRVYNSRLVYHVELDRGERYEVCVPEDNPILLGETLIKQTTREN